MDELVHLASTGSSSHELIANVLLARSFNALVGGSIFNPWNIDELTDEWLTVLSKLAYEMPQVAESVQQNKNLHDKLVAERMGRKRR